MIYVIIALALIVIGLLAYIYSLRKEIKHQLCRVEVLASGATQKNKRGIDYDSETPNPSRDYCMEIAELKSYVSSYKEANDTLLERLTEARDLLASSRRTVSLLHGQITKLTSKKVKRCLS